MIMMCISRSEVCSRFLAVWWCPKRNTKVQDTYLKYGLSEEAQAQKKNHHHHRHPTARETTRVFLFVFVSIFLFFYFLFFLLFFDRERILARHVDRYQFASHIKETHCMRLQ